MIPETIIASRVNKENKEDVLNVQNRMIMQKSRHAMTKYKSNKGKEKRKKKVRMVNQNKGSAHS